eukprot:scaffold63061_cov43-Phaeocystis_antarctica.AAC.4
MQVPADLTATELYAHVKRVCGAKTLMARCDIFAGTLPSYHPATGMTLTQAPTLTRHTMHEQAVLTLTRTLSLTPPAFSIIFYSVLFQPHQA